ncbi:MAG: hypothetical protein IPG96_04895 [Proteobacteria bacterium]|nr:hypothetical protein [Pseudomonadota bacterium]
MPLQQAGDTVEAQGALARLGGHVQVGALNLQQAVEVTAGLEQHREALQRWLVGRRVGQAAAVPGAGAGRVLELDATEVTEIAGPCGALRRRGLHLEQLRADLQGLGVQAEREQQVIAVDGNRVVRAHGARAVQQLVGQLELRQLAAADAGGAGQAAGAPQRLGSGQP